MIFKTILFYSTKLFETLFKIDIQNKQFNMKFKSTLYNYNRSIR